MPASRLSLASFDPCTLQPDKVAIFLDFDGTLADIAANPDAVSVPQETCDDLARLHKQTGGALAIVTGRAIADIDRFLAPLILPVAGVHGLERRDGRGARSDARVDEDKLAVVFAQLQVFSRENPGTLVERKAGSLALHYRQRPESAEACFIAVHRAVDGLTGLHILQGKMVIEVKAGTADKGGAVAAFMKEAPFRGRLPLFAGDDTTDEDAFREIASLAGISIKVGGGPTAAVLRSESTDAFRAWLGLLADSFESDRCQNEVF
ncbi:trehalose-phosphatase [Mesorhizobium xinjiangense]|uniref:trehalose-phosphatase n=1 Tax=Mesorhizobium xinjiangense TaxID=2678685 RepID=UPI0012EEC347|nr:trehalose-phosphatase [Mesorhizobium xinjiangense]